VISTNNGSRRQFDVQMKSRLWLTTAIILFLRCAPKVFFDSSIVADFPAYEKTFAFLPPIDSVKNSFFENDIMNENIRVAILTEMKKRGYTADTLMPELLIKFHLMIQNKTDIVNAPVYTYPGMMSPFPYNPYYFFPGPIYLGNDIERINYQQGTLLIDVIQRSSGKLVWRGWSVGDLDNPIKFRDELPNLVRRILKNYPIRIVRKKSDG
jgi:hypothetical protein